MTRPQAAADSDPLPSGELEPVAASSTSTDLSEPREAHVYNHTFWLTYVSNCLTTLANAMLVRYSDFVDVLGGDEQQLGLIVGVGMIGSIAIRLGQGEAIDRYGASRVWMWSVVTYSVSLLLHLTLITAYSPAVFLVRALMQASLAGVFGSSITFVALRVRPQRMAEVVGALGTSGFLGLMIGPQISDWLGSRGLPPGQMVNQMFWTASSLSIGSAVATWFATRGSLKPVHHERPSIIKVIRQYHPWMISVTAAMMGAGFAIPATFLRPFSIEAGLPNAGLFFFVYALMGFATRVATRSLFERFGNRPWIVVGMILLTASCVCYIPVTKLWHLILPAAFAGSAHALMFPSIMSAGTSVFPRQYLGVATSLILAMFDVGTLISAPVVGAFLRTAKPLTPNAYPWMFALVACIFGTLTVFFLLSSAVRTAKNVPR